MQYILESVLFVIDSEGDWQGKGQGRAVLLTRLLSVLKIQPHKLCYWSNQWPSPSPSQTFLDVRVDYLIPASWSRLCRNSNFCYILKVISQLGSVCETQFEYGDLPKGLWLVWRSGDTRCRRQPWVSPPWNIGTYYPNTRTWLLNLYTTEVIPEGYRKKKPFSFVPLPALFYFNVKILRSHERSYQKPEPRCSVNSELSHFLLAVWVSACSLSLQGAGWETSRAWKSYLSTRKTCLRSKGTALY